MRGSSRASAQYLGRISLIFPDPIKEFEADASEMMRPPFVVLRKKIASKGDSCSICIGSF